MQTARQHEPEEQLPKMSFGDHLDELRRRLVRSLIAVAVCMFALLPFKSEVTTIYVGPYRDMWRAGFDDYVVEREAEAAAKGGIENLHPLRQESLRFLRERAAEIRAGTYPIEEAHRIADVGGYRVPYNLVSLGGIEDFWTFMAASMLFAVILAAPIVLWQIWAFVGAGLYKRERRVVHNYVPFAFGLLTAGVLFGYFLVVPIGLFYLVKIMNFGDVQPMLSVAQYFSFLFTLTAALGFVFQLPLLMLALTKVGVVSHTAWAKNWRYIILGIFLFAAIVTPPDPFTQSLMAIPMVLLYLVGIWLTARAARAAPSLVKS
jgi:Tat protein translocase TatC